MSGGVQPAHSVGGPPPWPPPGGYLPPATTPLIGQQGGERAHAGAPPLAPEPALRQMRRMTGVWYYRNRHGTWRLNIPDSSVFAYRFEELGGGRRSGRREFTFSARGVLCRAGQELRRLESTEDVVTGETVTIAVEWGDGAVWVRTDPRGESSSSTESPPRAAARAAAPAPPRRRRASPLGQRDPVRFTVQLPPAPAPERPERRRAPRDPPRRGECPSVHASQRAQRERGDEREHVLAPSAGATPASAQPGSAQQKEGNGDDIAPRGAAQEHQPAASTTSTGRPRRAAAAAAAAAGAPAAAGADEAGGGGGGGGDGGEDRRIVVGKARHADSAGRPRRAAAAAAGAPAASGADEAGGGGGDGGGGDRRIVADDESYDDEEECEGEDSDPRAAVSAHAAASACAAALICAAVSAFPAPGWACAEE
eukprot:gene6306-22631_t